MNKLKRKAFIIFLIASTAGLYLVSFIVELYRLPKETFYKNGVDVMLSDAIKAWNTRG